MKKNKGFTLIELVAVLVIMAIIALIVTPLVMNIIRKAKISADKRSIDAYGRSIELAIAGYLMDTGTFPTQISELTVEYSGDEVVCSTTRLKDDGTVYLAGCTVGGRTVSGYTYGTNGESEEEPSGAYEAYSVGDEITYNNVDYYVIEDSGASESTVTLLKAEPLSYSDVQTYSAGTGAQTSDQNGYGGMQYHSESNSYATSYVKTTVDAWKAAQAPEATEARLITKQEIDDNFELEEYDPCGGCGNKGYKIKSSWMYDINYSYLTMSEYPGSLYDIFVVRSNGSLDSLGSITVPNSVVRPVIVLPKSAI